MSQDLIQKYRGVICQCCRQPIPLPAIVLRMETSRKPDEPAVGLDTGARVFALRCRSCEREMPYRSSEIVDVDGVPKPRLSRAKGNRTASAGLPRAASA